jgi:guanine nucleotide-binding protein alpha-1 subunit
VHWRAVIQLNVVRSVRTILDAISDVRRRELPVSSGSDETDEESDERARLPTHLETIAMRLLPLRHIEALLVAKLVPPSEEEATHLGLCPPAADGLCALHRGHPPHEIFVRPGAAWKGGVLARARPAFGRPSSAGTAGQETQDESQLALHQCRDDMIALWNDRTVRDVLRKRKMRLEESPGL